MTTAPHHVADALTPAGRLDAALDRALTIRRRALRDAPRDPSGRIPTEVLLAMDRGFLASVKAAAGEYAAALVEQCARTPRSQMDPLQMRRGDAL